ncbi:hypothetical protein F5X96DRAFT_623588 [Biscogniauxia mediterranea]|nr:hypothetical protein F5X96DRAFT_623588 [Biscogniauxia mediterranea]
MSTSGRNTPSPTLLPPGMPHFAVDPQRPSSWREGISIGGGGGGKQPLKDAFFYQIDEAARAYERGTLFFMRDVGVEMRKWNLAPCTSLYISALIFDADGRLLLACPRDEDERPDDTAPDDDDITSGWMPPGTWCRPTDNKVLNYLTAALWKNL